MRTRILSGLFLLCASGLANAEQGCAQGFFPGGPADGQICIPIPGYGVTNNVASPAQTARWKYTWGAIAMSSAGHVGATVGHYSRGAAKREATANCKRRGGQDCKIQITYKHQCVAIAWPSIPSSAVTQTAESVEIASKLAQEKCRAGGGGDCEVVYSACTDPVLIGN